MIRNGIRYAESARHGPGLKEKRALLIRVFQMTHVFQNYGPGVRYICFTHGGKDTQFWAGWYGIRVTDSCVEVCPAVSD